MRLQIYPVPATTDARVAGHIRSKKTPASKGSRGFLLSAAIASIAANSPRNTVVRFVVIGNERDLLNEPSKSSYGLGSPVAFK